MNAPVFDTPHGMACRACGSFNTRTSGDDRPKDICTHCWRKFDTWRDQTNKRQKVSPNLINEFLARELFLSARRLLRHGVTGRCEALALNASWLFGREHIHKEGFQCGLWAVKIRDGRRVCGKHFVSKNTVFEYPDRPTQYDTMRGMLVSLAAVDETFHEMLQGAAAAALTRDEPRR